MDLAVVLDNAATTGYSTGHTLTLILSHGVTDHEAVLCGLISRLLSATGSAVPPSGDASAPPGHSPSAGCLFIALHKTTNVYQRLLNPASQRLLRGDAPIQFIDASEWLQAKLYECISSTAKAPESLQLSDDLCQYVKEQISQFCQPYTKTQGSITIVFDNITTLFDLGISVSQLHRLLVPYYPSETNRHPSVRLVIGCHVGRLLDDPLASQSEPSFVHWIDLLKSRANRVIELRPLSTGYTVSVDGELSVHEAYSSADPARSSDTTQIFHYRCDGLRVLCYPPGTSKLIT